MEYCMSYRELSSRLLIISDADLTYDCMDSSSFIWRMMPRKQPVEQTQSKDNAAVALKSWKHMEQLREVHREPFGPLRLRTLFTFKSQPHQ